jgi:hypothetical protein
MGVPLPSGGTYPPLLPYTDRNASLRDTYQMHLIMDQQETQVEQVRSA